MGEKGPIPGETVYRRVPFEGAPALGRRPGGGKWPAATKRFWESVSRMPHAVDFTAEDWELARFAALTHARVIEGDSARAGEFRLQAKSLGVGPEGRARLGIRYVEESEPEPSKAGRVLRLVDDAVEA